MIFQQVCEELKKSTGEELKQVLVFDHEAKEVDCGARLAEFEGDDANEVYERLKDRVDDNVQLAFHCTGIIVGESASQWDLLRWAQTHGINYGLDTEDLVRELEKVDAKYGIKLIRVDRDQVHFRLKELPEELDVFIDHLCRFCPDLLAQMYHDPEVLKKEIRETKTVPLWWD
ncbi:DUF4253 domain-containing protein [Kroppenstedtia eburnea]|uniref:DUF4253 domain-containing protein n=1 Tax=Kroppenstedtia eburnea TaxID=714067 RepID=UPI00363C5088